MAAAVWAEPPGISKSYLPPSANGYPKGPQGFQGSHQGLQSQNLQSQGFQGPQGLAGAPEVVAARSFAQGREQTHGNNLARNSVHDSTHSEGYDSTFGRNGEAAAYEFGYTVDGGADDMGRSGYEEGRSGYEEERSGYEQGRSGGPQFGHHEEGRSGEARGAYHVVLPDGPPLEDTSTEGTLHVGLVEVYTVNYEADERGFKPQISYQDSEDFARSGYDSNTRNQNGARGRHGNEHGRDLHVNGIHGDARSNGY
ncbi:pro-resilin-like [Aricia agestis]|uniref:pro-resilin-like n=1 Tax=Aricia agestis TaxID=91739 RepID=UPI001C208739|nr:pro-resilin-like [Aricia agestis]